MSPPSSGLLRQHLIDPDICIRCNTCEDTCKIGAITHDKNNYVVKADVCNACGDCLPPCPTGAIDSWRQVVTPYTLEEQFGWESLPAEVAPPSAPAVDAEVLPPEVVQITAEEYDNVLSLHDEARFT